MAKSEGKPPLKRVAIVGRPNVGKSTLFNRIAGRRRALVGDEPGMTRDRLYAKAEWLGKPFEVVDTGGMIPADGDLIAGEIFRHAWKAIEEAAYVVLVVDGREGVVPLDEELAQRLRRTGKPLALAVNKVDTIAHAVLATDFARLGIRDMFPVSAEHGLAVDDLLEFVTAAFPRRSPEAERAVIPSPAPHPPAPVEEKEPAAHQNRSGLRSSTTNIAIIGRPNVGKSTLLNRLLGEERAMVTPIGGTTRDAVDAEIEREGRGFRFIDTAGIRRKGKTKQHAEKLSVLQARQRLEQADLVLVVLDASEGVTAVDSHIAGYAHQSGRSVIIVVNKWDAAEKKPATTEEFTSVIRRRMKYLDYAPVVFLSALQGQRLGQLWRRIDQVAEARWQRIPTSEMNAFLNTVHLDRIPSPARWPLRIYYLTQASVAPPTFVAFANRGARLHFSVERFLENRIREKFGFTGTPILIKCRARH
jgi:GTP-binding protein